MRMRTTKTRRHEGSHKGETMDMFQFRERPEQRADERTEELARKVIGAAIEVHRHLGPGMPENSYCDALSHELDLQGIEHQREVRFAIVYKGKKVGEGRLDMLVGGTLIVEVKVVESLNNVHRAQVISYLQATKPGLGLLINFNVAVLKDGIKRVINTF
jgi:GxxExxY protein